MLVAMLISILVLTALGLVFGLGLGWAAIRFRVDSDPLIERIDALLPQTQCGQCGFPGCRPYAEAISSDQADINQCPPGGEAGVKALADLLGREPKPLNPERPLLLWPPAPATASTGSCSLRARYLRISSAAPGL